MSEGARDLLVRGIAATKAKDMDEARFYLEWVLRTDSSREQKIKAWLWLSEVYPDPAQKRDCLENVLAHDPADPLARRGLALLEGRLKEDQLFDANSQAAPQPELAKETMRRFVCLECGGRMRATGDHVLRCEFCGRQMSLYQAIEEGSMVEEQDFAVALATAKGHAQPVCMPSFHCESCGAGFVPGPGVISLSCPYCNSDYVVKLADSAEIVPPEAIIPFAVERDQATGHLSDWLKQQRFHKKTRIADTIAALFVPVWTFDVGGEIRWQGSVLYRQPGNHTWMPQNGTYPVFYDDILVPATPKLSPQLREVLRSFELERLKPYDPGYLADRPAEIYQISPADASLVARRRVWAEAEKNIRTRISVELGQNQQLNLSSAGLIVEAFKLILLPVWLSGYRYENREFDVAINGQNGLVYAHTPRSGLREWLDEIF